MGASLGSARTAAFTTIWWRTDASAPKQFEVFSGEHHRREASARVRWLRSFGYKAGVEWS